MDVLGRENVRHVPVMESEVVESLRIRAGGCYVDATFGRGGHAKAILANLNSSAQLHVFDRDPTAIEHAHTHFANDPRVHIYHSEFSELSAHLSPQSADGILLDLGVSSPQLDDADRGFSFLHDGPLDMRMNPTQGMSAATYLATAEAKDLALVLSQYGEERFAMKIAQTIVKSRETEPLTRTKQLADLVASAIPRRFHEMHKHPATRSFQAIRIWVNQELLQLSQGLQAAFSCLAPQGRLAVISFHSLEDRQVKNFMRDLSVDAEPWRGLPNIPASAKAKARLIGRAQRATSAELHLNPRARSAVLRVLERV